MRVCTHDNWNGISELASNQHGRVTEFDAKGSMAVAQIVHADVRQRGNSGAAG